MFEGWDAAGKGGAIRRVTAAVDARLFRVMPVAAPTVEEQSHHFLWRCWRQQEAVHSEVRVRQARSFFSTSF